MNKTAATLASAALAMFLSAGAARAADSFSETALKGPVLVIGDSLMRTPGRALEKLLKKEKISSTVFTSLGSGLARIDAFDWFAKIDDLMKTTAPSLVVMTMGANDNQSISNDGGFFQVGTPEWTAEYSQRIGKMMDKASGDDGKTPVLWILLPPMKEDSLHKHALAVNVIVEKEAKSRKNIVLYDPMPDITPKSPKKFVAYAMSATGQMQDIRSDDSHFSATGGDLMAKAIMRRFWNKK